MTLLICIWSKSLRFLHNQYTVCFWILIWFSVHWFSRFYICLQYTDSVWLVLIFVNCLNLCRLHYKFLLRICILTLKRKFAKRIEKGSIHPPPLLNLGQILTLTPLFHLLKVLPHGPSYMHIRMMRMITHFLTKSFSQVVFQKFTKWVIINFTNALFIYFGWSF